MADLDITEDAFLGGRLMIAQPAKAYRAGLDAVLLAAACRAGSGERVLDAGAGVGVVGLSVAARVPGVEVVLVERQSQLVELAHRNVERSGLAARVRVVEADIGSLPRPAAHEPRPESFEHTLANPPYLEIGRGRTPPNLSKAEAHEMEPDGLETWARYLARMTAPGGSTTIIHRADALSRLLCVLEGRFGGIEVVPIHPRVLEPANRILVIGRKGSRAPLRLLPPVILHGEGNRFLPPIEAVLRNGAGLDLAANG